MLKNVVNRFRKIKNYGAPFTTYRYNGRFLVVTDWKITFQQKPVVI